MRFLLALLLTATSVLAANPMVLTIEQSTDNMGSWQAVPMTATMLNADGKLVDSATSGSSKFYRMRVVAATPTPTPTPITTPMPTLAMVTIQGGTMPSSSGLAGQIVATFSIGKYEVTWDEWLYVRTWAVAHGYDLAGIGAGSAGNHPVREVNWYDVVKWCNAMSEMEGLTPVYQDVEGATYKTGLLNPLFNETSSGYRLPREVEWEWAARGGTLSKGYTYSGSNNIDEVGWYDGNSLNASVLLANGRGSWPVGSKKANELGLFDMSGNVFEWCWNVDPSVGYTRFARGGGWHYYGAPACRVVDRSISRTPETAENYVGLRPARSAGN
jgi:formylglycine-generating enzyme required for sulfatase activity